MFRLLCLILIGLFSGGVIASGFFAFLTAIGIIPNYAGRTHTASFIKTYETAVMVGGILGNAWWILDVHLDFPGVTPVFLGITGLGYGIFTGSLVMGLAEIINVIPILFRRTKITRGLPWVVASFAVGKALGNLISCYFE